MNLQINESSLSESEDIEVILYEEEQSQLDTIMDALTIFKLQLFMYYKGKMKYSNAYLRVLSFLAVAIMVAYAIINLYECGKIKSIFKSNMSLKKLKTKVNGFELSVNEFSLEFSYRFDGEDQDFCDNYKKLDD